MLTPPSPKVNIRSMFNMAKSSLMFPVDQVSVVELSGQAFLLSICRILE